MPRASPCRVLRILALPWALMFGLWVFLPSPTVSESRRLNHIQDKLSSGRTVIAMIEYQSFRRHPGRIYGGECSECENIFPHWTLEMSKDELLLRLNDEDENRATINLSRHFKDARAKNAEDQKWTPFFSGPCELSRIPGGSPDEEINLPWFSIVDQNLFHYDMHGFDATIQLTPVVTQSDTLQLWKSSAITRASENVKARHRTKTQHEIAAEVYESLQERVNIDLVATLRFPQPENMKTVVVDQFQGDLPSFTYPIRRFLLFPLGPIIILPFLLLWLICDFIHPVWPAIYVLAAVYAPIVLYFWIRSGCPRIWQWLTTFWMTRWIFCSCRKRKSKPSRDVWGPAGPVERKSARGTFDEEDAVGLQRPQTVRLGRTWKS